MKYHWILFLVVNLFILVSCGGGKAGESAFDAPQEPESVPPHDTVSNPEEVLPQPTPQGTVDFSKVPAEKFVELAKNDLAKSLGITARQIDLVDAQAITWPNSALGCPAPGKTYPQGQVPGYRIYLSANGQEYIYHTDINGYMVLCPSTDQDEDLPMGPNADPNIGVPIP